MFHFNVVLFCFLVVFVLSLASFIVVVVDVVFRHPLFSSVFKCISTLITLLSKMVVLPVAIVSTKCAGVLINIVYIRGSISDLSPQRMLLTNRVHAYMLNNQIGIHQLCTSKFPPTKSMPKNYTKVPCLRLQSLCLVNPLCARSNGSQ